MLAGALGDPAKARTFLEALRWPNGAVCPRCPKAQPGAKLNASVDAESHARDGVYQCKRCRRQFTVTVGTVMEDTRLPLNKWLQAIHILSQRPITTRGMQDELGVSKQTVLKLIRRIHDAKPELPGSFNQAVRRVLTTRPAKYEPIDPNRQAELVDRFNRQRKRTRSAL